MIGFIFALILGLQGAPAAQQGGSVAGQIQGRDGSRPAGVRVSALTVPSGNMGPETGANYFEFGPPAATALTDAQGRFRLEGLPAGRYFIMAGLVGQPTYYSGNGAGSQNPSTITTIAAGQSVPGLDFKLLFDVGTTVSGRINLGTNMAAGQTAVLTGSKVEEFLQTPLRPDGTFEFGRVPAGSYLLTTFPLPPGVIPQPVIVRNTDVKGLELAIPSTQTVTGKIVMQNGGPIPVSILGFYNVQSYIGATVNGDGTFAVKLHPARHTADVAGLPVGYRLVSVQLGSNDVTKGFNVGNTDVSGITVTVAGPLSLPRVKGKVNGLPIQRTTAARVELTGPIFGSLQAALASDGSFEIPKVVPGLYKVRVLQVPEFTPVELVVTSKPLTEVQLTVKPK